MSLPDSTTQSINLRAHEIPGQLGLPLIITPEQENHSSAEELADWIRKNQDWLHKTLCHHGGVLFRDFEVTQIEEFNTIAQSAIPELKPYVEGQSPRSKVVGNVYTSTEFPSQYRITLHNELSYTQTPPTRIVFHAHIAPECGGETPIVDCRQLYTAMPDELLVKFEQLGVRYVKNMHGQEQGLGKSWMEHFETDDPATVESYLAENAISYEWKTDGSLRTSAIRPGIIKHPFTGEMLWFNQADLWHITNINERHRAHLLNRCGLENLPTHSYFGDGTPISDEEMATVRAVLWDQAVIFPWQQGDVLILDNLMVAHGRMPFEGPRKILVAMG